MKEVSLKATTSNLRHDAVEIPSLTRILGAARRAHDYIESALLQDGERIDHHLMVLVSVKLIWQVKIILRQSILCNDFERIRGQERCRRLGREANHADPIRCPGVVFIKVAERTLAAEHNGPP
jgi:hypothetical protein